MSAKPQPSWVITANRLSDGTVLYLDPQLRWVEQLAAAKVTADAEERDRLLTNARGREGEVCGPYALDLLQNADGTQTLSVRERLRALGSADVRRRLGY